MQVYKRIIQCEYIRIGGKSVKMNSYKHTYCQYYLMGRCQQTDCQYSHCASQIISHITQHGMQVYKNDNKQWIDRKSSRNYVNLYEMQELLDQPQHYDLQRLNQDVELRVDLRKKMIQYQLIQQLDFYFQYHNDPMFIISSSFQQHCQNVQIQINQSFYQCRYFIDKYSMFNVKLKQQNQSIIVANKIADKVQQNVKNVVVGILQKNKDNLPISYKGLSKQYYGIQQQQWNDIDSDNYQIIFPLHIYQKMLNIDDLLSHFNNDFSIKQILGITGDVVIDQEQKDTENMIKQVKEQLQNNEMMEIVEVITKMKLNYRKWDLIKQLLKDNNNLLPLKVNNLYQSRYIFIDLDKPIHAQQIELNYHNSNMMMQNRQSDILYISTIDEFYLHLDSLEVGNIVAVDIEGNRNWIELIQMNISGTIIVLDIYSLMNQPNSMIEIIAWLKSIFENKSIIKVFHDARFIDIPSLHNFLGIDTVTNLDTSILYTFHHSVQKYCNIKQNIGQDEKLIDDYVQVLKNGAMPGLNDVLQYYEAKNGVNHLKQKIGEYFNKRQRIERPIDVEYLEYSAMDVRDLVEVTDHALKQIAQLIQIDKQQVLTLVLKLSYAFHK